MILWSTSVVGETVLSSWTNNLVPCFMRHLVTDIMFFTTFFFYFGKSFKDIKMFHRVTESHYGCFDILWVLNYGINLSLKNTKYHTVKTVFWLSEWSECSSSLLCHIWVKIHTFSTFARVTSEEWFTLWLPQGTSQVSYDIQGISETSFPLGLADFIT